MKQFKRSDRVGEEALRTISRTMETELAEHFSGMVTFTHVRMSADLRYATVYYSFLGKEDDRKSVAEFFLRENGRIRHKLGANLRLRHIPELTFKYDPSIEEGMRIERLLNEIKSDKQE